MSDKEAIACGLPVDTPIYPDQYLVRVSSRGPFMGEEVPAVTEELKGTLRAKGYEILTEPRTC